MAGFRRYEAIRQIAEADKIANPTIEALVKDLNPVSARLLNLRENTARNDLQGADLCYGIAEICKLDSKMTGTKLAEILNKSQPYMNKLMKINEKFDPELFKHWRDTPGNPVTVFEVYALSGKEKDEQGKLYFELFKGKAEGPKKEGNWKEAAKTKAAKIGTLLGDLEREYGMTVEEHLGGFEDCIERIVKFPEGSTSRDKKAVAKACYEAYTTARDATEEVEDEEEETEVKPKNGKK